MHRSTSTENSGKSTKLIYEDGDIMISLKGCVLTKEVNNNIMRKQFAMSIY